MQPTIIIVDDEIINIHSLARILRGTARLCFATSGKQALQLAKKLQPEMILLDVMLPDLSGFEVCKQLKNNPETSRCSVIFVTALGSTAEEAHGLRLGALDYIIKPFNPTIVRERVQNLLNLTLAYRKLEELSSTDFLTGAFNRRYLFEIADTELKRHRRHHRCTSIMMLDIDHFKEINDRYGHSVGDQALRHLVQVCHENLRDEDIFARFGGEEFCVLLPETDATTAKDAAERLRQSIKTTPMALDEQFLHMTVSIGLSGIALDESDDINYWLEQADKALYHAKENGRDQVVLRE
ncbi:MAG: diguanylate cyclase [Desulfuromonadaceae bacterium]|nr:diguanylate cyclase [Desulfuromonadaceae bacterium]